MIQTLSIPIFIKYDEVYLVVLSETGLNPQLTSILYVYKNLNASLICGELIVNKYHCKIFKIFNII